MKIVKISSLGCPSCIIMNKVFNKIKENYSFDYEEFDYDFDETDSFNAGNVMPVYIFYKNDKEVARLVGEHNFDEFSNLMEKIK